MAELSTDEILMQITHENLETGLRGYPVGYCVTSSVDPQRGLFYQGLPVSEMAYWSPEEVIYLLWFGHKPTREELDAFAVDLRHRSHLDEETVAHIRALPRHGAPMKLLSAALLLAGMIEGRNDWREDALDVVAKIPLIVAEVIRHHAGWGPTPKNDPKQGYMENFTRLLGPPGADLEQLTGVFRVFNVLHYDHGGGNLSVFTGKAVASGLEDLWGCLSAAMCALAGPRHGKANQDSLQFVQSFIDSLGADVAVAAVAREVRRRMDAGELIYGFGHAVLRVEDPRATVLYQLAEKSYRDHPLVQMALQLRAGAPPVLAASEKVSDPYPNVDAISGSVLAAAGFAYPEYFTLLFGLSRCVGIARQIVYERVEARSGKGVPIYRPKFFKKELPR